MTTRSKNLDERNESLFKGYPFNVPDNALIMVVAAPLLVSVFFFERGIFFEHVELCFVDVATRWVR